MMHRTLVVKQRVTSLYETSQKLLLATNPPVRLEETQEVSALTHHFDSINTNILRYT